MGGSAFGKTFGKLTTKVVDPFGISKPLRKIIDPLNIMDPLNVLPTSGEKWLTPDKNYGAPLMNWLNPKQSSYAPMTKGLSSNPEYFAQQQQVLNNMRQQQQTKLANLRSQGDIYPSAPSEASQVTPTAATAAATAATTTATPLAKSKIGDTPADVPIDFIYKPAIAKNQVLTANTFQMPDMSNIKFGGA